MKWFKRKQIEIEIPKEFPILVKYIEEARNLRWEDGEIVKKFKEKNYPDDLIESAFTEADEKLTLKKIERRITMAKDKEDLDEDEQDFEDDDEDEIEEEVEEEVEKVKPKKVKKVKKENKEVKTTEEQIKQPQQPQTTMAEIFQNHEQRLQAIEAKFFRMLSA